MALEDATPRGEERGDDPKNHATDDETGLVFQRVTSRGYPSIVHGTSPQAPRWPEVEVLVPT